MNKKSLIWTLASLMVLASMILAACGGGATEAPAATQPPAATEPPAMTEAPTEAPTEAATEAATQAPVGEAPFPVIPGGELEKALTGAYTGTTVTVDGAFEGNDPDGVKMDESVAQFEELTGIRQVKPFECVGTVEEVNLAVRHIIEKKKGTDLPVLLKHYLVVNGEQSSVAEELSRHLKHIDLQHHLNEKELALLKPRLDAF